LFGDVEDVVDGDDAEHLAVLIDDGQGGAVVFLEGLDGVFALGGGGDADDRAITDAIEALVGVGQNQRAEAKVLQAEPAQRLQHAGSAGASQPSQEVPAARREASDDQPAVARHDVADDEPTLDPIPDDALQMLRLSDGGDPA
jgi:hypothetical protein